MCYKDRQVPGETQGQECSQLREELESIQDSLSISPFFKIFYYAQYSFYMTATKLFPLHIVVVCTFTERFGLFFRSYSKFQGKRVPDSAYVKYVHMVQSTVACGVETHIKTYDCYGPNILFNFISCHFHVLLIPVMIVY